MFVLQVEIGVVVVHNVCVCVKVALFYIGMSPKPVVKAYDLEDKLNLKSLRIIYLQTNASFWISSHGTPGFAIHAHTS